MNDCDVIIAAFVFPFIVMFGVLFSFIYYLAKKNNYYFDKWWEAEEKYSKLLCRIESKKDSTA